MAMPTDVPIIDCMIGFPIEDKKKLYEFITKQTKDSQSKDEYEFPVEYMFKDVPDEYEVAVTIPSRSRSARWTSTASSGASSASGAATPSARSRSTPTASSPR